MRECEISIFKINEDYYAEIICSCELQTEIRLLGHVKGDENSIDIFFRDILPGAGLYEGGRYEKNELLIALSYTDMELQSTWYALRKEYPNLWEKEEGLRGTYFKKTE